ncbi:MAG: YihY/virulence factor BrkB family protein [Pseudomonadota bacterium]
MVQTDTQQLPTRPLLYWQALRSSFRLVAENDLSLIAAGVAFFGMLSLFPALAALIALLGLVSDPIVVLEQMEALRPLVPEDVFEIINAQVLSLVSARADALGWAGAVSLFLAIWTARAGTGAMIIGLNSVYQKQNRATTRHYLRAILITLGLMGVGIVAVLMVVVAPVVLAFFPLGAFFGWVFDLTRYTIAVLVLFAGIAVLYRFGPNRRPARMPWISFGAVVAVLSWALVSIGFSYYVSNFGNYNQVYGSIGAVIVVLIWLWITSFLVLFGGLLNAQIEKRRNAVGAPPSS